MASYSSTLAWKIPGTEETWGLQSMGSLRVGHDWVTSLSLSCTGEGNGNPLQCSCLENPRDGGAWGAALYGVKQSQTQLKWLSSSREHTGWDVLLSTMGHCHTRYKIICTYYIGALVCSVLLIFPSTAKTLLHSAFPFSSSLSMSALSIQDMCVGICVWGYVCVYGYKKKTLDRRWERDAPV